MTNAPQRGLVAAAFAIGALAAGCTKEPAATGTTGPAGLQFDASVPALARDKVSQVTTPLGTAAPASAQTLPKLQTAGDTLLLAADAAGDIHLAAVATADAPLPPLSARTTALALVRLSQGTRPQGVTGARWNDAIVAATEFAALERLVAASHAAGTAPLLHPGVAASLLTTTTQARQSLPAAADGRAAPLALAPVRVNAPLPYPLLQAGPLGTWRLRVAGADEGTQGALLQNGLPIHIAARAADANAPDNGLPPLPPGEDPPYTAVPAAASLAGAQGTEPRVGVPGIGSAWNLLVYRTPRMRTLDGVDLAQGIWNTWLQGIGSLVEDCAQPVPATAYAGTPAAAWASLNQGAGFDGLVTSLASAATYRSAAAAGAACVQQRLPTLTPAEQASVRGMLPSITAEALVAQGTPFLSLHALHLRRLLPAAAGVEAAYDLSSTAAKLLLAYMKWDAVRTVGVCQGRDAVSGALQLAPCPTRLDLLPRNLPLPVGSAYRYTVTAEDDTGAALQPPTGLTFSSSEPRSVAIDAAGVITVLAPSFFPAFITVTDPVSRATGSATVQVTAPVITPPPAATETLDFASGVWSAGSYFQGGPTPADPVSGGFRFSRSNPLDDPLLSRSQGVYVSGLKAVTAAFVAADAYAVAVERVSGAVFDALSVEIGLFDNASGASFRRPALEFVGLLPGGTQVSFTTSPASFAAFGAGAALARYTLPATFTGITRLSIRMKANPSACDSCRIALTLDNLVLR